MDQKIIKSVANQSYRYGKQMRGLMNRCAAADLVNIQNAWGGFRKQFIGTSYYIVACRGFLDGIRQ